MTSTTTNHKPNMTNHTATLSLAASARPVFQRDKFLRMPAVEEATGLKRSTLYMLQKRGEFPNSIQISARCVAWPESAVLQWVQNRIAAADKAPSLKSEGAIE